MYSKYIARVLCSILILNSFGCLSIDTEWEDLESDYDHVLNVLGVINLDPGQTSFIGLYRTTDLDELSQVLVDIDTIGYYEGTGMKKLKMEKMATGSLILYMNQRH